MHILGINTGLNASVVLLKDGKPVFGVQEERLSRIKNQPGFPKLAVDSALKSAGIALNDLDIIAIGGKNSKIALSREDDLNKFHNRYNQIKKKWFGSTETIFAELAEKAEAGIRRLSQIAHSPKTLENYLDEIGANPQKIKKYDHHLCHAASAYYGLAKDKQKKYLVFSMDGGGDGKTSAVYIGENGKLTEIASSDSFSPACIYAHITYIMGFMPHEHEYKLMGMAPYAQPKYAKIAKEILMRFVALDGLSFTNGPKYPGLRNSQGEIKQKLVEDLFKSVLNLRFDTLAAGLQLMAEEVALQWIKAGVAKTGIKNVLLSGGFFMNVKANKLISELPELESVNVFPSCGDETNAFGAAFLAYNDSARGENSEIFFEDFCLGPSGSEDIEEARKKYADKVSFTYFENINDKIVELLIQRKIVARCSGKMEFGARALGNRSILAAPDDVRIINKINAAIKKRDFWMPFAPAVLEDKLESVATVPKTLQNCMSPYMMFTFDVKPEMADKIIAGVHQADKTARAQTVNPRIYPEFYDIISRFYAATGIPAVLNTSFNLHGFPIVLGACDAVDVYLNSELDYLIVGNWLITRK